jgi:hypothetical protein
VTLTVAAKKTRRVELSNCSSRDFCPREDEELRSTDQASAKVWGRGASWRTDRPMRRLAEPLFLAMDVSSLPCS